eukprot:5992979-Pyramimonas_sp.AAC.1
MCPVTLSEPGPYIETAPRGHPLRTPSGAAPVTFYGPGPYKDRTQRPPTANLSGVEEVPPLATRFEPGPFRTCAQGPRPCAPPLVSRN